jgi:hypothetical protein
LRHLIRAPFPLFIVLLAVCASVAQQTTERPRTVAPESREDSWKRFSSADGFSVDFPGTPTLHTEEINTPTGKYMLHRYSLSTLAEYGVIYADYPDKIEGDEEKNRVLNNGAQAAAENVHSELLSLKEITVDGNPGRLLSERMRDGASMYAKMVLVGSRLYQVAATLPRPGVVNSESMQVYEEAATRFLNSFKLSGPVTLGELDRWSRRYDARFVPMLFDGQ